VGFAKLFVIVWEFRAKRDCLPDFERAYEPNGDWGRLFQREPGFAGTQLLRDREDITRFLTVDTWKTRDDYEAFRAQFDSDYLAIDARTEAFTDSEERIRTIEPFGNTLGLWVVKLRAKPCAGIRGAAARRAPCGSNGCATIR
jgi:heme-degrading monooxygenase HmoA